MHHALQAVSSSSSICVPTTTCLYGSTLINNTCIRACPADYFYLEGYCYYSTCEYEYTSNSVGGCIRKWEYQCPEYRFYLAGSCVKECGVGFVRNMELRVCEICPLHCDVCSSQSYCFKCGENYTNIDGSCHYQNCGQGQVAVRSDCTGVCPAGTINNNDICLSRCQVSTFLHEEKCYYTCPSALYSNYACLSNITAVTEASTT